MQVHQTAVRIGRSVTLGAVALDQTLLRVRGDVDEAVGGSEAQRTLGQRNDPLLGGNAVQPHEILVGASVGVHLLGAHAHHAARRNLVARESRAVDVALHIERGDVQQHVARVVRHHGTRIVGNDAAAADRSRVALGLVEDVAVNIEEHGSVDALQCEDAVSIAVGGIHHGEVVGEFPAGRALVGELEGLCVADGEHDLPLLVQDDDGSVAAAAPLDEENESSVGVSGRVGHRCIL